MNPSPLSILRAKDRDRYTLIPELLKLNDICIEYRGERKLGKSRQLNVKSFRTPRWNWKNSFGKQSVVLSLATKSYFSLPDRSSNEGEGEGEAK